MKQVLARTVDSQQITRLLVAGLLVASITLPGALQAAKAVVLGGALVLACIAAIQGRLALSGRLYAGSLALVAVGLAWSAYGVALGNPGAWRVMTVTVLYPTLLPFLAPTYEVDDSPRLYWLFAVAGVLLVLLDLAFVAAGVLGGDDPLTALLRQLYDEWAVVDTQVDFALFTLPNVASLSFLLPFFLAAALLEKDTRRRLIALVLTILGSLVAVLASRRAVFVVTFVAPVIAMLITPRRSDTRVDRRAGRGVRLSAAIVLVGVGVLATLIAGEGLTDLVLDRITSIGDFSDDPSNAERRMQFDALIQGIAENPLLGSGAGAAASYVRSDDMPWAYELYYVSLLFQYGLVGFAAYLIAVLYLIDVIRKRAMILGRASFEHYLLCGMVGFLLASATNPNLGKFDYMWVVFIPFAIANRVSVEEHESRTVAT